MGKKFFAFFLLSCFMFSYYAIPVIALPINSGWTDTPPTIDGQINPANEWNAAASETFTFSGTPPDGGVQATFYVMNDANNVYFLLVIQDDEIYVTDNVYILFDNDNGGGASPSDGDDAIQCGSVALNQLADLHWRSDFPSWDDDNTHVPVGTIDGAASATQDGSNILYFEFSHPLCSGDHYDFCLSQGDTVGFTLRWNDRFNPTQSSPHDWPGDWQTPNEFDDIILASNPHVSPVGGEIFTIDKLAILTPYLIMAIVLLTATSRLIKKQKH